MKIYEIQFNKDNQKAWVCANTVIEALWTYFSDTAVDFTDLHKEDDVYELPEEKWGSYNITDEEGTKEQTFEEFMKTATKPELIAVTED